ncbi:MAG: hypothetical protein AAF763_11865 [Pseudomonadota bacterium]
MLLENGDTGPAHSSVSAPVQHLMSGDFFGAEEGDLISFASTSIEGRARIRRR